MNTTPALADADACRAYLVRCAARRAARRDSGRALVADFAKALLLSLGILTLAWVFLYP